ncbi:MAG: NAD(P)/FAD-dependent oxidoreductase [Spirochaetes bacterium]|nr:NAD(P)/FAD-dependent oxidoreductase [Spirochaetota bacterium]MBN2772214.1 NAD(P)/FAD-dependent oxidoreductase [Spirochaetota bacterium]
MGTSNSYHTIVIGAGPAGLFCAGTLGSLKPGLPVLLLEKMKRPGRKLLLSGAGSCNITNDSSIDQFTTHYGKNGRFMKHALYSFSPTELIAFFKSRNINCITDKNGKYFPSSKKASDILNSLTDYCLENGVITKTSTSATTIIKHNDLFIVRTAGESFTTLNVVVATGGKSYPGTGSTGDGYLLAQSLGHTIVPPVPALASVVVDTYKFCELSGISFEDVILTQTATKNRTRGGLLFTHTGISGPAVLHLSRYLNKKDTICADLIPDEKEEETLEKIKAAVNQNGRQKLKHALGVLPVSSRFMLKLYQNLRIDPDIDAAQVSKKTLRDIANTLHNLAFKIQNIESFEICMATAGGISLKEISGKSFESKLVKGLYFIGETIDIDGDSGGYNLQAAFSTAFCAARHISQRK